MALLRNGTVLNQYPLRQLGGGVAADITMFGRGDRRNIYSGTTDLKSGTPNGHVAPSSWLLPLKPGGMSSFNYAILKWTATADGVMGVPISAATSMDVQASGTGSLITSGEGSAAMSFAVGNAQLIASLSGTASTQFSITGSGTTKGVGALAGASSITFSQSAAILPTNDTSPLRTGTAVMSFSGTLTSYAVGAMIGDTVDTSVLTSTAIANNVWSLVAAENNEAGSMGNKLNSAASGGVDYTALGVAVWSHLLTNPSGGSAGAKLSQVLTTGNFLALKD